MLKHVIEAADDGSGGLCKLVPGFYGVAVQLILGFLALSILLLKFKFFEHYHRTDDVFVRDVTKIFSGALWLHLLNIVIATLFFHWFNIHRHDSQSDACDFYFLSIMLDTTIGLAINYHLLKVSQSIFHYACGDYGARRRQQQHVSWIMESESHYIKPSTPSSKESPGEWSRQLRIWLLIVTIMKFTITIIIMALNPWLSAAVRWILSPFQGHPQFKLLFIMVAVPLTMNSFQYWITDQVLEFKNVPASQASFVDKQSNDDDERLLEKLDRQFESSDDEDNEDVRLYNNRPPI